MNAPLPQPVNTAVVEREYRCDHCGRRVNRYTRDSIETGWDMAKPVEDDDSCWACWPSGNLRDAMDRAEGQ